MLTVVGWPSSALAGLLVPAKPKVLAELHPSITG